MWTDIWHPYCAYISALFGVLVVSVKVIEPINFSNYYKGL